MNYGYCRVSTMHQSLTRQVKNIKETCPGATIFEEKWTGTTTDRPSFNRLLKIVKEGDTIYFDEISRMSRNAAEGYQIYRDLYERGINLVFIKERALDTDNFRKTQQLSMTGHEITDVFLEACNKVLWLLAENQIKSAFEAAETEVTLLHKRVSEGMKEACKQWDEDELLGRPHEKRKPGRQKGAVVTTHKSLDAKRVILRHSKDFGGSLSDPDCIKLAGCSRNAFYKFKRELKQEAQG